MGIFQNMILLATDWLKYAVHNLTFYGSLYSESKSSDWRGDRDLDLGPGDPGPDLPVESATALCGDPEWDRDLALGD